MYRYFIAWFCLAIWMPCMAKAQASPYFPVKLRVQEAHNNTAVADAVVFIDELKQAWDTDESGTVTIDSIQAGIYHVHIHSMEITDTLLLLNITAATGSYTLKVPHNANILRQVLVRDQHIHTILQSKDGLDQQQITAGSGQNLSQMLSKVNGVSMLSNGATVAKPVIHGLHSNRILILNNGIRQEDQQWGAEHAPDIDPFLANTITVLKGAAGVRYGTDAIGGVILVAPAPLPAQPGYWGGSLNLAAFSNNRMGVASAMLEHASEKIPGLSFRVQGTYKKGGNYQVPGGYYVANTGLEEKNYSGTVAYHKAHSGIELFYSHFTNTLGIYTGSHTGSQQDLINAVQSPVPLVPASFTYAIARPMQQVQHDLVKLNMHRDNAWGLWNLTYAYQHNFRQEYDIMRVSDGKAQLNLTLNTQTLNLNLDHKAIGPLTGQLGVDGGYQDNFFRNGDRVFIPSYTSLSTAAYAIERYTKARWSLEAGLRFDYKHYQMFNPEGVKLQNVEYLRDYRNASGTLALQHRLTRDLDYTLTLSNAWRAPQANELFSAGLHQGGARIELGDKELKPETSWNLNLETRYNPGNRLKINLSLYAQAIGDYIYLKPGGEILTIRGYYKVFNYVQTNALLYGADLSCSYAWNAHLSSDFKASVLRARDQTQKDWLILMPSDRFSSELRYTRDLGQRFKASYIGLNGRYVLQQTRIPANFDQIDYPRPPAAYFLLEAQAGTTLQWGKQTINCSITVSNLLNNKYRDYMDVFRYFIDQPGRNIVLRLNLPFNFTKH